ncbi:23106_t:CDS:1, partial [Gigaspora rosea]
RLVIGCTIVVRANGIIENFVICADNSALCRFLFISGSKYEAKQGEEEMFTSL